MDDVNKLLDFVYSERCNVYTPPNKAVISGTNSSRDPIYTNDQNGQRIPLRQTPGALAVNELINACDLKRSEEEQVWQALEDKYVSAASGELTILSMPGKLCKARLQYALAETIFSNPRIRSINGISVDYFFTLFADKGALVPNMAAQLIVQAGKSQFSNEILKEVASALMLRRQDYERQAIAMARDSLLVARLRPEVARYHSAERDVSISRRAHDIYKAFLKKTLIARIPVLRAPFIRKTTLLKRVEIEAIRRKNFAKANVCSALNELRSHTFLEKFNATVNKNLIQLGVAECVEALTKERKETLGILIERGIQKEVTPLVRRARSINDISPRTMRAGRKAG